MVAGFQEIAESRDLLVAAARFEPTTLRLRTEGLISGIGQKRSQAFRPFFAIGKI